MVFPNICTHLQNSNKLPIMVDINRWKKADLPHFHNYTQFSYVLAGTMSYSNGEDLYTLNAGGCTTALPYVHHHLDTTNSEDTPMTVTISFNDDFLTERGYDFFSYDAKFAQFEGFAIPPVKTFEGEEKKRSDELINRIITEFSKRFAMSFDLLSELLAEFLRLLCTEPVHFPEKDFQLAKEHANNINASVRYIALHYAEKISTLDLCRIAAMSQSAYTRKFKHFTSMTPSKFLTEVRVSEARLLLITTNLSITEIAYQVGFYDKSHLIHAFKELFGESPLASKSAFPKSFFEIDELTTSDWAWLENREN